MTIQATTARRKVRVSELVECWYVPGSTNIVDLVHPDDELTLYGNLDAVGVAIEYPGAVRMLFETAQEHMNAAIRTTFCAPVSEITEEAFDYALNVLPPVGWRTARGVESFKMSERTCGSVTNIYARLGDRYFMLADDIRTPAEEIAKRVAAFVGEG